MGRKSKIQEVLDMLALNIHYTTKRKSPLANYEGLLQIVRTFTELEGKLAELDKERFIYIALFGRKGLETDKSNNYARVRTVMYQLGQNLPEKYISELRKIREGSDNANS